MHEFGLFTDPAMNILLAAAGMYPITTGVKVNGDRDEMVMGLVDDWDAEGNIYHVQPFPVIFSYN